MRRPIEKDKKEKRQTQREVKKKKNEKISYCHFQKNGIIFTGTKILGLNI